MLSVLITGANRGIGLALARGYAAEGWRVHACCRHPDKAKDLKALKAEAGDRLAVHRLDVTDGLMVAGLARELAGEAIDLLINNAGVGGPHSGFGETDYDDWPPVIGVNSFAPLRMAERFVEHVAKSERKLIVNISSKMGSIAANVGGNSIIYRASKAALNQVSKSMAMALGPRGITVIVFHPGWGAGHAGGQRRRHAHGDRSRHGRGQRPLLQLRRRGTAVVSQGSGIRYQVSGIGFFASPDT
jgi:NAD(P)-dependent dehydrogenase (short-subunit alcohol dehydrogenase family)